MVSGAFSLESAADRTFGRGIFINPRGNTDPARGWVTAHFLEEEFMNMPA